MSAAPSSSVQCHCGFELFYSVSTQLLYGSTSSIPHRTESLDLLPLSSHRILARALNLVAIEMKTSSPEAAQSLGNSMQNPRGPTSMVSTTSAYSFPLRSRPRMVMGNFRVMRMDLRAFFSALGVDGLTSIYPQRDLNSQQMSFGLRLFFDGPSIVGHSDPRSRQVG